MYASATECRLMVCVAVRFVDMPRFLPSHFHMYDMPLGNGNALAGASFLALLRTETGYKLT